MDFFENVIDKIIENLSKGYTADSFVTSSAPAAVSQLKLTDNVSYRLYLYLVQGMPSDIILYSPESSKGNTVKHDFSEEEWKRFAAAIRKVVSVLVNTEEKRVAVSKRIAVGIKDCAPCDGMYFDEQYRIRFDVNCLEESVSNRFQSLHFEISNNLAKLTLFDRGTYVFESVPEDTPLSYFDIDEAKLISATEELIALTEPCSETVVSSHFENTVYSDKSGGYYLKYIKMD